MNEREVLALIDSSREIVIEALDLLGSLNNHSLDYFIESKEAPKEMKSEADLIIEKVLFDKLSPFGFPILSEESGIVNSNSESSYRFIVDPIDGTVNFVRGLSQSTISIAFYCDDKPIFGVLGVYPSNEIIWGGERYGSFSGDQLIKVSRITKRSNAILCTGFPSRFNFEDKDFLKKYIELMAIFGKVRMLGSASLSILSVANGSADYYFENEIMIWDIAAAIAILEGAGGSFNITSGVFEHSLNVTASNGNLN